MMKKAMANRIKATILYATETGQSLSYAKTLQDIFNHAFDARVSADALSTATFLMQTSSLFFIYLAFAWRRGVSEKNYLFGNNMRITFKIAVHS